MTTEIETALLPLAQQLAVTGEECKAAQLAQLRLGADYARVLSEQLNELSDRLVGVRYGEGVFEAFLETSMALSQLREEFLVRAKELAEVEKKLAQ